MLNRGGDFKPLTPYREIFKSPTIRSSKSSEDTQPFIAGLGWVMFQGKNVILSEHTTLAREEMCLSTDEWTERACNS